MPNSLLKSPRIISEGEINGMESRGFLEWKADKSTREFINYGINLRKFGFYKHPLYWLHFFSLLFLGQSRCDKIIQNLSKICGGTPRLGKFLRAKTC